MKKTPRLHSKRKRHRKGDTGEWAAQLAPLEEQDQHSAAQQTGSDLSSTDGAIVVDNDDLKVRADIMEARDEKRFLGFEPVVLVVLVIMLGFIAFITWRISLMPADDCVRVITCR